MGNMAFFRGGGYRRWLPPEIGSADEAVLVRRCWELLVLDSGGAARLAALGHGDFSDPYGVAGGQMKKCYEPHMSEDQRQYLLNQWERAVQRAMHWAQ